MAAIGRTQVRRRAGAWLACAVVVASMPGSSAIAQQLQFSEDTTAHARLEQRLHLPDRSVLDVPATDAAEVHVPAAGSDVLVSASGSLVNTQDMPPAPRTDFLCASAPAEQYDPARAEGFEPATAQYDAPWLQATGRLRWHAGNPDPVRCHLVPVLVVSPPAIDFGVVPIGQTRNVSVSISNAGDSALSIGTLAQPRAPFSFGSGCSGATLQAGQSCSFVASYAPTSTNWILDSSAILSNDPLRIRTRLLLTGSSSTDLIFRDGFD